jgi:putative redox protein
MTSLIIYNGQLRTSATHLNSGTLIETDAPKDNNGKGEKFSPTDLVATALGTCMMTVMGIAARDKKLPLEGTRISIEKIMGSNPRRIVEVKVTIDFPEGHHISLEDQTHLERVALNCPVAKSIHPDIKQTVSFNW